MLDWAIALVLAALVTAFVIFAVYNVLPLLLFFLT
jgi:hypothetical protein